MRTNYTQMKNTNNSEVKRKTKGTLFQTKTTQNHYPLSLYISTRSTEAEVKQTGMSWNQLEKVAKDGGRWRSLVDDICPNGNLRV